MSGRYVLGISCFYHDSAACLIRDGILISASDEERFSRIKHDESFPKLASQFVLEEAGIEAKDLDYVVFYEKPFLKFDRLVKTTMATHPKSMEVFQKAMPGWFGEKLWIVDSIMKELGVPREKILFSEHHISHGASSYYCSPFKEAAILTMDGVGEWTTTTIGVGKGLSYKVIKEIHFPHSLGMLYSAFTSFLGFEVNEGEYKVMGMAGYGTPKYKEEVEKTIRTYGDGSFALDLSYFTFQHSSRRMFSDKLEGLFGEPRKYGSLFFTKNTPYPRYFGEKPANYLSLAEDNQRFADIAASVQKVTEDAIVNLAREAHRLTGLDNICLAGGVALNGLANWRVAKETPFKGVYIQPAAGDSGGAIGAAFYAYHAVLGHPRKFVMTHAQWGKEYTPGEVNDYLKRENITFRSFDSEDQVVDYTAQALASGKVAGWFQGKAEWGPRALGGRSILADPSREEMKDIVNVKIKFREPYRPFAPSVLSEHASSYFDCPQAQHRDPAKFMLYVVDVAQDKKSKIPAVTHVDGTARLQSVSAENSSPVYRKLIERFYKYSGTPMVMNTSFNLKGEPIVGSPADAMNTFTKSGLDLLVLGNTVVEKIKHNRTSQKLHISTVIKDES